MNQQDKWHFVMKARSQGVMQATVDLARAKMIEGRSIIFVCSNQREFVKQLQIHFPGCLFEMVKNYGIRVWERKRK